MNEKWYGEKCEYQRCRFETDCEGYEDKSEPMLIFCVNAENKINHEGNCNLKNCPINKNK